MSWAVGRRSALAGGVGFAAAGLVVAVFLVAMRKSEKWTAAYAKKS
jgi:hypothetical protein